MTSGKETERVYSYNPGAKIAGVWALQAGHSFLCWTTVAAATTVLRLVFQNNLVSQYQKWSNILSHPVSTCYV